MWACHLDRLDHLKLLNRLDNMKQIKNNSSLVKMIELDVDNDGRTMMHWSVRKNEPLECLNVYFLKKFKNKFIKIKSII